MSAFGIDVDEQTILILSPGLSKHEALDRLIKQMTEVGGVSDAEAFRQAIYARESVMSTGIGGGIAIPHVRIEEISKPTVGVAVSQSGIEYAALDNAPVHIIVMFAMPSGSDKEYLGLLAQVMMVLKDVEFRHRLLKCSSPEELASVLNQDVTV